MMSTGDEERVNPGVPAAHADSFGPRRSLPSPRALSLSAKVTPWPPAPRPERVVPATPSTPVPARRQPKLLDRLREALRSRHYSRHTERTRSDAQRPGPQVSQRPLGLALAVGFSAGAPLEKPQDW